MSTQCQWFAKCYNDATCAVTGPVGDGAFGLIPTCDRCADFTLMLRHPLAGG